jgi:hypothetical protein
VLSKYCYKLTTSDCSVAGMVELVVDSSFHFANLVCTPLLRLWNTLTVSTLSRSIHNQFSSAQRIGSGDTVAIAQPAPHRRGLLLLGAIHTNPPSSLFTQTSGVRAAGRVDTIAAGTRHDTIETHAYQHPHTHTTLLFCIPSASPSQSRRRPRQLPSLHSAL